MKREIRKIAIVVLTTIFSIGIHALAPPTVPLTPDRLSAVANALSFEVTVTIFFLVTYYLIATVFLRYEPKLSGRKLQRALLFGCLIGGIWWVGMIEAMFAFDTHFMGEFVLGLLDFIPIVVLCLLLAVFVVEERPEPASRRINSGAVLAEVGVFSALFTAGRGFRYLTIGGGYGLVDLPAVMLWTAAFAVMIALNYVFLKSAFREASPMRSALRITLILFGIHYALFVYFVPLVFSGLFVDLTIVLVTDLVLVLFASFITAQVVEKVAMPLTLERMAGKE